MMRTWGTGKFMKFYFNGLCGILTAFCFVPPLYAQDIVPPAGVMDLQIISTGSLYVQLGWAAPGDNGQTGIASFYDIRYATSPVTSANWDVAIQVADEPQPQAAGSSELFKVSNLTPGLTYYFALKTADNENNWSGISNIAEARTLYADMVFASNRSGSYEIYSMSIDGTNVRQLTKGGGYVREYPNVSAGRKQIVFSAYPVNGSGNDIEIYTIDGDGENLRKLTSDNYHDRVPQFSPDGSKIVFESNRSGRAIYLMNSDGSVLTRLTNNLFLDRSPSFSPDGSQILFDSERGGMLGIYVMNVDGSNQQKIISRLPKNCLRIRKI